MPVQLKLSLSIPQPSEIYSTDVLAISYEFSTSGIITIESALQTIARFGCTPGRHLSTTLEFLISSILMEMHHRRSKPWARRQIAVDPYF